MSSLPPNREQKVDDDYVARWLDAHAGALHDVARQIQRVDDHLLNHLKVSAYCGEFLHGGDGNKELRRA